MVRESHFSGQQKPREPLASSRALQEELKEAAWAGTPADRNLGLRVSGRESLRGRRVSGKHKSVRRAEVTPGRQLRSGVGLPTSGR